MRIESKKEVRIFGFLLYSITKALTVEGKIEEEVTVDNFDQDKLWEFLRKIERELTRICGKLK